MSRRVPLLTLSVAALLVIATAATATPRHDAPVGPDRTVSVMTRNIYFGADLTPVVSATTPEEFLAAAVAAFEAAQLSDFPARAAGIAAEIAANDPALVGIQEATWWRVGPIGDPAPAETAIVDFVALILDALDDLGEPYEVVAAVEGFDAELPVPPLDLDVRLTIGDVLLRRVDLPAAALKLSNISSGHYATTATVDTPIGPLAFLRQWIAADVKIRGREFRFITTHLESIHPAFRTGQALELLAGPAATSLPVVAVGDFNAQITSTGDAAAALLAGGFEDAWSAMHPVDPGLTCCQDADLRNGVSDLTSRIDLVLTRGGLTVQDVRVVGAEPDPGLSALGVLYPSDHAGVVADLVLPLGLSRSG